MELHTMDVDVTLHTDGKGLWSNHATAVKVTKLALAYVSEDGKHGELRVYFDTKDWDTTQHGLIYTDRMFLKELRNYLDSLGISRDCVYSEQGMQGDDYVSLDCGEEFIESF